MQYNVRPSYLPNQEFAQVIQDSECDMSLSNHLFHCMKGQLVSNAHGAGLHSRE